MSLGNFHDTGACLSVVDDSEWFHNLVALFFMTGIVHTRVISSLWNFKNAIYSLPVRLVLWDLF